MLAVAGAVVGAAIGVVLHALVWRSSLSSGGWYGYSPLPRDATYSFKLHMSTSGGLHTAWWPLLFVTLIVGLLTGALLGALGAGYRTWQLGTAAPAAEPAHSAGGTQDGK